MPSREFCEEEVTVAPFCEEEVTVAPFCEEEVTVAPFTYFWTLHCRLVVINPGTNVAFPVVIFL